MRIVHVVASVAKGADGVREVVFNLAEHQIKQGMNVSVVSLECSTDKEGLLSRVPLVLLPIRWSKRFGYSPSMVTKLIEMSPDVVHVHGLWMYPNWAVLRWHNSTQKPFILSPHGMLSKIALSYGRTKKLIVSILFQRKVFNRAACLVATSSDEMLEIRAARISKPVALIPNGVNVRDHHSNNTKRDKIILSLGRIHKKKGLDNLILAWEKIHENFPDWSVLIVGPNEGQEREKLERIVEEKRIPRVRIEEGVYGEEKIDLMSKVGVFVLPTLSDNFALTVAESLILGVPVIASEGAPWKDLEKYKCGYWIPIGVPALVDGLRRFLLLDERCSIDMGLRGRAWMQREFSWSSKAADTILLYKWSGKFIQNKPSFIEEMADSI